MEEEKEGEREEGGKGAAGKPLPAGRERGKEGSGKTAGRREEKEGRRKGRGREIGGSKKNPLHLVRDGADLLIVGGIRGDYLRSTFLPFLMTMPL